ncbi:MAG: KamA family protein [Bacteroidetes bacterium HGW-Bacteroidetes-10]|nr:MAG: KamA family protein [Bacteroidetes bacterium HGW-Bacteroidetes-10]
MAKTLYNRFKKSLPDLYKAATESSDEEQFIDSVRSYASLKIEERISPASERCAKTLLTIAQHEKRVVSELSRGEKIYFETLSKLWYFLNNPQDKYPSADMYEDLYNLFLIAEGKSGSLSYTRTRLSSHMKRWPSGLDKEIRDKREKNKNRLIIHLIKKIEKRTQNTSRYWFPEGLSFEEKQKTVELWWNDYKFHLTMAARTPGEVNALLGDSLPVKTMKILNKAKNKGIPFFVTPYYISLLNPEESGYDDHSVRSYVIYSESLVETYGNIKAWEREDLVEPGRPNAAGWLLPDSHSIHRRYPEVAIMIPETRGRSCGGLCASCQRMYDFQSERLNFDLDALKPRESWDAKLNKLMQYFREDSQIRDILITGGDALMTRNKPLEKILDAVLEMAGKKISDNLKRADGEKFAELQRVRLGSRLLAYLPFRINNELGEILSRFREKGLKAGITQFVVQTHFQSPLEVTPEARKAIEIILSAGWTISNQLVFNAAASRRGHTARLRQILNSLGVITYYTFTVKGFAENRSVFAPNSRSLQEAAEEKIFGKMTQDQERELNKIFVSGEKIARNLKGFMKESSLPFLPTDRNVLNLPAIGKSMTFETVGITPTGERILKFDHDRTRKHSPIIDQMGEVYIAENCSVASYLRELEEMGENRREYNSIWSYTIGETEPVFWLFKYPKKSFTITKEMSNLSI